MKESTPAKKAMAYYFVNDHAGRKGNRVTIATALSSEYKAVTGNIISNTAQYQAVVSLAHDRAWKELVQDVTDKFTCIHDVNVQRKKELRLIAKQACSA